MTHTCTCGNTITVNGWNNTINTTLRCQDCQARREQLLEAITKATAGINVDTVYISMEMRDLVGMNDFTFEVGYRRQERMNGLMFIVVAA